MVQGVLRRCHPRQGQRSWPLIGDPAYEECSKLHTPLDPRYANKPLAYAAGMTDFYHKALGTLTGM